MLPKKTKNKTFMFLKQIKNITFLSICLWEMMWQTWSHYPVCYFLLNGSLISVYCLCKCFKSQGVTSVQCLISVNNVETTAWTGNILHLINLMKDSSWFYDLLMHDWHGNLHTVTAQSPGFNVSRCRKLVFWAKPWCFLSAKQVFFGHKLKKTINTTSCRLQHKEIFTFHLRV